MENEKNDWYRGITRELSYFTAQEIINAYQNMDEKYGVSFYNILIHLENGLLTMIRKKSELKKIIDYIESQPEESIINQLQEAADMYDEMHEKLKGFKLNVETWKELMKLCRALWTRNMFCIYFGYGAERKKIQEIREKNYELVVKVRNDINDLFILDDFLKNYFDDLDLTELSFEEIGEYLENNKLPTEKELNKRRKDFLILTKNLQPEEVPQDKIKETIAKYLPEIDYSGLTEVKGRIAFKGNATGRAKVILRKEDLNDIQEGDIFVTLMTNPEYEPFMLKIAGIVTDDGGATCHASIIAREMKVPCIVGTKHATKVFKTGDIIEIDSEGIARKC
ncbi:PEP-utilizing enzyme [Nanoarchaeota archaeon]